ncbi:MAG: hypothetical protein WCP89_02700 [archaeon]
MTVQVREKTVGEIKEKLRGMLTPLNKISYLESALGYKVFTYEIKRFLWGTLAELYEEQKLWDKAAKAYENGAGIDITFKDKIESYLKAAELYAKVGRIDEAEQMFVRAMREASDVQRANVKLARKNIYMLAAQDLDKKGKRGSAMRFYEHLIKMNLDELEKRQVKGKLLEIYKSLGKFNDAKLIEGM